MCETLAALASIPGRAQFLPRVLFSLRGQVNRLCVYLNGYESVPDCVRELADEHVLDVENRGAEKKFQWASSHAGVYLSCDDDLLYPQDYVATMCDAVRRWDGEAIVTAHGRSYEGAPTHVHQVAPGSVGVFTHKLTAGRWVNHGGTGVMAWDTRRVRVPSEWPERNVADMQVSIWAQRNGVPIWLREHPARWIRSLAGLDPQGIFITSRRDGHRKRNALLERHGRQFGWSVFQR